VLLAALTVGGISDLVLQSSKELGLVKVEALREQFPKIVKGSVEDSGARAQASRRLRQECRRPRARRRWTSSRSTSPRGRGRRGGPGDRPRFRDPPARGHPDAAASEQPDPDGGGGGREDGRRGGLPARIAEGDVPPPLKSVAVRTLDLGLLQAGAGIKGEFENRLKSVINEVKASPQPIILFIDEAHTMIGAGGQAGQSDAANLLKPALARGELRTIAATTWSEYKKYFEKDAALARRFQVVKVEEPTPDQAVLMMRYLAPKLEKHHQVRILDEAVEAAVRLSDRYLSGRQLPDKSVSVLDQLPAPGRRSRSRRCRARSRIAAAGWRPSITRFPSWSASRRRRACTTRGSPPWASRGRPHRRSSRNWKRGGRPRRGWSRRSGMRALASRNWWPDGSGRRSRGGPRSARRRNRPGPDAEPGARRFRGAPRGKRSRDRRRRRGAASSRPGIA